MGFRATVGLAWVTDSCLTHDEFNTATSRDTIVLRTISGNVSLAGLQASWVPESLYILLFGASRRRTL